MSTTMPEVEVSTGKATNGNTAVKTAIHVKTASTTSTATTTASSIVILVKFKNMFDLTVSSLFNELIMED
ncbi:hypothetical protein DY000_02058856 [Brassica cretica]|uniref:Uncharacterized protein n=1 Tax=Brassica cretica TaxID=69181 RepID=A0ABQ7B4M4_BRACR|nr:hypothetical protein DY000_02058856 [Brassica cretica]